MVRFDDAALEEAVQRTSDEVDAKVWAHAAKKHEVAVDGKTRLVNAAVSTKEFALGTWLGSWRVPARVTQEKVTVVRSIDGTGLSCAPSVSRRRFTDPLLQQGEDGAALLDVLAAFDRPTTVNIALAQLKKKARFDPESAREVIDHLTAGRFLQPG
jgi:hypothetical protein